MIISSTSGSVSYASEVITLLLLLNNPLQNRMNPTSPELTKRQLFIMIHALSQVFANQLDSELTTGKSN